MSAIYVSTTPYLIAKLLKRNIVLAPEGRMTKGEVYAAYMEAHLEEHEALVSHIRATEGDEAAEAETYDGPLTKLEFFRYLPAAMAQVFPRVPLSRERLGPKFGSWVFKGIEPMWGGPTTSMEEKADSDDAREQSSKAAEALMALFAAHNGEPELRHVTAFLVRHVKAWR